MNGDVPRRCGTCFNRSSFTGACERSGHYVDTNAAGCQHWTDLATEVKSVVKVVAAFIITVLVACWITRTFGGR